MFVKYHPCWLKISLANPIHVTCKISIHRDVALRNCIITQDSIIKLSSIALCKDKHANEYFKHNNKMIPLRHLAPELLASSSSFSTASDVFACGVAIWEVMNGGALPFGAIANDELFQMLENKSIDYGLLFENDKVPSELQKTLVSGAFWASTFSHCTLWLMHCIAAELLVDQTKWTSTARRSHKVTRRIDNEWKWW